MRNASPRPRYGATSRCEPVKASVPPPWGRTWLRKAKNCTGRCPADAGMKSKCHSRAGSSQGPSPGKYSGRPHHRGHAHWPAPNSAFSAAQSGSPPTARESTRVGDGLKPASRPSTSAVHCGESRTGWRGIPTAGRTSPRRWPGGALPSDGAARLHGTRRAGLVVSTPALLPQAQHPEPGYQARLRVLSRQCPPGREVITARLTPQRTS